MEKQRKLFSLHGASKRELSQPLKCFYLGMSYLQPLPPFLGESEAFFGPRNKAHVTESKCDDDSGDDNDIGENCTQSGH